MFRRAAVLRAADVAAPTKMQTLHKILTGEVIFKNKNLTAAYSVEAAFGANWKSEFDAYAKTLPAPEQAVAKRQADRVLLTRYTARELAKFAANGPQHVDATARLSQLEDGRKLLKSVGDAEFSKIVSEEAKLANWDDAAAKKFVADVKSA